MTYAPITKRMLAFLIDYVMIALYAVVGVGTISVIFKNELEPFVTSTPLLGQLIGFVTLTLPVMLYFMLSEYSSRQATVGKKIARLRVATNNGTRITLLQVLIRTVVKFLPWEIAHFG